MNNAKCPNLVEWIDWVILMCNKGNKPYVPDQSELRDFCKNKSFNKCPHNSKPGNYVTGLKHHAKTSGYEICHR